MLSSSARLSNRQMKLTHTTLLTDDWLNNYTIDHMYSTSVLQLSLQIELKLEQIIQPRSLVEPFLLSIKANAAHVITAAFKTLVLALWRCFRQGKFQVEKKNRLLHIFLLTLHLTESLPEQSWVHMQPVWVEAQQLSFRWLTLPSCGEL